MQHITVTVERYAYPRVMAKVDVPAYIVGSLAVHRELFWGDGENPPMPRKDSPWRISHIATGMQSCPPDIAVWISGEKRATAMEFARQWQAACPEFFAQCDKLSPETVAIAMAAGLRALAMDAIDKARCIRINMERSN